MDELINNCLTILPMLDNLSTLSPSLVVVRGGSRKNQEMPVKARLIRRLRCQIQKFYGGRYLRSFGSHGSLAMSTNSDNVHRPKFGSFKRCSLTFKRDHTMSQDNSAQQSNTQAQTEQHQTNIIARTANAGSHTNEKQGYFTRIASILTVQCDSILMFLQVLL